MIECKLEDFENYRKDLFKYACSLLKTRGFCAKDGELKCFGEDLVQQTYLQLHSWGTSKFVTETHLRNFLFGVVYREYLHLVDINRRGAQYILLKKDVFDKMYSEEFKQIDIRKHHKPTQEFFDCASSFKKELDDREVLILNGLIDGYSQREISEKIHLSITIVHTTVKKIRDKYKKHEGTNC